MAHEDIIYMRSYCPAATSISMGLNVSTSQPAMRVFSKRFVGRATHPFDNVGCVAPRLRNILLRPGLASAGLAREDALSRPAKRHSSDENGNGLMAADCAGPLVLFCAPCRLWVCAGSVCCTCGFLPGRLTCYLLAAASAGQM